MTLGTWFATENEDPQTWIQMQSSPISWAALVFGQEGQGFDFLPEAEKWPSSGDTPKQYGKSRWELPGSLNKRDSWEHQAARLLPALLAGLVVTFHRHRKCKTPECQAKVWNPKWQKLSGKCGHMLPLCVCVDTQHCFPGVLADICIYNRKKECVCTCGRTYLPWLYINDSFSFHRKYPLAGVNLECISQQQTV